MCPTGTGTGSRFFVEVAPPDRVHLVELVCSNPRCSGTAGATGDKRAGRRFAKRKNAHHGRKSDQQKFGQVCGWKILQRPLALSGLNSASSPRCDSRTNDSGSLFPVCPGTIEIVNCIHKTKALRNANHIRPRQLSLSLESVKSNRNGSLFCCGWPGLPTDESTF